MIRKSGNRFSLVTNAKRLRGDHAQTKRQRESLIQLELNQTLANPQIGAYSAAAASEAFAFADDTMKSEMRGTISDLKREPLKTP